MYVLAFALLIMLVVAAPQLVGLAGARLSTVAIVVLSVFAAGCVGWSSLVRSGLRDGLSSAVLHEELARYD